MHRNNFFKSMTASVLMLMMVVSVGCTQVDAGAIGVQTWFGSAQNDTLPPGLHFTHFYGVTEMSTRTQEIKEELSVPTNEGLIAGLDVSVLFHLDSKKAVELFKNTGDDKRYKQEVLEPIIRSIVRDVVSGFKAEDLYTHNRLQVAKSAVEQLKPKFEERGLVLEQVLIRDLRLPQKLKEAIETKLSMDQEAQQMAYKLRTAELEAKRKAIEAQGVADAQKIIANGLTQEYLTWKYIETLKELVNSPNNTVIITPMDQKLTPMLQIQQPQPVQILQKK